MLSESIQGFSTKDIYISRKPCLLQVYLSEGSS